MQSLNIHIKVYLLKNLLITLTNGLSHEFAFKY